MGCIKITQEIKALAASKSFLNDGEEAVKNLVSLWQEQWKKPFNVYPTEDELRNYKNKFQKRQDPISLQGLSKEIKTDTEGKTKQQIYKLFYNQIEDLLLKNPNIVNILNKRGGGRVLLNAFTEQGEYASIYRAAFYKAAINYNRNINEAKLGLNENLSEAYSNKTKIINIYNTLYDATTLTGEDVKNINSTMNLSTKNFRIEGITAFLQIEIEKIIKRNGDIDFEKVANGSVFYLLRNKKKELLENLSCQKDLINTETDELKRNKIQKKINSYTEIIDNFDLLAKKAIKNIETINGIKIDKEPDDDFIENEKGENYSAEDSNTRPIEESIGEEVLKKLSSIQKTDSKGRVLEDDLGFPHFENPHKIMGTLLNMTETCFTSNDMEIIFNKYSETYPFCRTILDLFKTDSEFRSGLYTACRKDRVTYAKIIGSITKLIGGERREDDEVVAWMTNVASGKEISSEHSFYDKQGTINLDNFAYWAGEWNNKVFENKGVKISDVEGVFGDFYKKYKNKSAEIKRNLFFPTKGNKNINLLTDFLNAFGIPATRHAVIVSLNKSLKNASGEFTTTLVDDCYELIKSIGIAANVIDNFLEKNSRGEKQSKNLISLLYGKTSPNGDKRDRNGIYLKLLNISKRLHNDKNFSSDVTVRSQGKNYTMFSQPSFITTFVKELRWKCSSVQEFRQRLIDKYTDSNGDLYEKYAEYREIDGEKTIYWKNPILRMIYERGYNNRTIFTITRLLEANGKDYTKLNKKEYLNTVFQMFKTNASGAKLSEAESRQQGRSQINTNVNYYPVPILSDKEHTSFFTAPSYSIRMEDLYYCKYDSNNDFQKSTLDLFYQELQQIDLFTKRQNNKINDLPCQDRRGKSFVYLTGLNNKEAHEDVMAIIKEEQELSAKEEAGTATLKDRADLNEHILKAVYKHCFIPNVENTIKTFHESGFFNTERYGYKNNIANQDITGEYNSMRASIEGYMKGERTKELFENLPKEEKNKIEALIKNIIEKNIIPLKSFAEVEHIINKSLLKADMHTDLNPGSYKKCMDFTLNNTLAQAAYIQISAGDLSAYPNFEQFTKRQYDTEAQTSTPDVTATWDDVRVGTEFYKMLVLQDEIISAKLLFKGLDKYFQNIQDPVLQKILKKAYEEVNRTDGQSYRTLQSYRKAMIMTGHWNRFKEASYKKIISGQIDYRNTEDIYTIIKPFFYDLIEKESGVDGHSNMLVPMQIKDSESPIFAIIVALAKGDKEFKEFKKSKLYQLNEYMVENDIEVVGFNSTIKSSNSEAVETQEENFKQYLENVIGTKNGFKNKNALLTLSYQRWGIQMPTKEHYIDQRIAAGIQMERIAVGNFRPDDIVSFEGKNYRAEDLKREYQMLLYANAVEKYKKIEDIFSSPQKLQNQLLKSLSPLDGDDLAERLALTKDGRPLLPLWEADNAIKIQQKSSALVKNRLSRNEFRGGTATQMSCFGVSEDLNVVLKDKDGNLISKEVYEQYIKDNPDSELTYEKWFAEKAAEEGVCVDRMECYLPMYSKKMFDALIEDHEDGTQTIDINKMPEELRRIVGYRNPSEAKYSINNLYIKGFLPTSMAGSIILPTEITLLAGSDFDIDKLFLLFKEFIRKTTLYDKANIKDFTFNTYEKYKEGYNFTEEEVNDLNNLLSDFIANEKRLHKKGDKITLNKIRLELNDLLINQGYDLSLTEKNYLEGVLIENKTKLITNAIEEVKYDKEKSLEENSIDQRNNRILDIMQAFLSAPQSTKELLRPGGFPIQEHTGSLVRALQNIDKETIENLIKTQAEEDSKSITIVYEEDGKTINIPATLRSTPVLSFVENYLNKNVDPLSINTMVETQHRNMQGKQMLAVSAVHSTALYEFQDTQLSVREKEAITLDGHTYTDAHSPYATEVINGQVVEGDLKSSYVGSYLSAAADNGKKPTLPYMGLNMSNITIALTLSSLGYSPEIVGMFFSQPIIHEIFDGLDCGKYKTYEEAKNQVKLKYTTKLPEKVKIAAKDLDSSFDNMAKCIMDKDDLSEEEIKSQLRFLTVFEKARNISGAYVAGINILRGDSSHGGILPTVAESTTTIDKQKVYDDGKMSAYFENTDSLYNRQIFDDPNNPIDLNDLSQIEEIGKQHKGLISVINHQQLCTIKAYNLLSAQFPQAGDKFRALYDHLLKTLGTDKLPAQYASQFFNDMIMYAVSSNSFYGTEYNEDGSVKITGAQKRSDYIKNFPDYFVKIYNEKHLQLNPFLQKLIRSTKKDYPRQKRPYILCHRRNVFGEDVVKGIKEGWDDLAKSNDVDLRNLSMHLLRYCFYTQGNNFSPQGFEDLMSYGVRCAIPQYADTLYNLDNIFIDEDVFIDQFIRNYILTPSGRIDPVFAHRETLKVPGAEGVAFSVVKAPNSNKGILINTTIKALRDEADEWEVNDAGELKDLVDATAEKILQSPETNVQKIPRYIAVTNKDGKIKVFRNVPVVRTIIGEQGRLETKENISGIYLETETLGDGYLLKEYVYGEKDYKGEPEIIPEEEQVEDSLDSYVALKNKKEKEIDMSDDGDGSIQYGFVDNEENNALSGITEEKTNPFLESLIQKQEEGTQSAVLESEKELNPKSLKQIQAELRKSKSDSEEIITNPEDTDLLDRLAEKYKNSASVVIPNEIIPNLEKQAFGDTANDEIGSIFNGDYTADNFTEELRKTLANEDALKSERESLANIPDPDVIVDDEGIKLCQ